MEGKAPIQLPHQGELGSPNRYRKPHSACVDVSKPAVCPEKQNMTLPVIMSRNRYKDGELSSGGILQEPNSSDLTAEARWNSSPGGNDNTPFAASGHKTHDSQTSNQDVFCPTRHISSLKLPIKRVPSDMPSDPSAGNADSADSVTCLNSPNPFEGLRSEPHRPPKPKSPYKLTKRKYPPLFQDQFAQFMEDRMIHFRPASSQNNVESSLHEDHPYQSGSPECIAMRTWAGAEENQSRSALSQAPAMPEIQNNARESLVNESNSSFLPRGVVGPPLNELSTSAMAYTPQAVPLEDAKISSPQATSVGCICMPWSF